MFVKGGGTGIMVALAGVGNCVQIGQNNLKQILSDFALYRRKSIEFVRYPFLYISHVAA